MGAEMAAPAALAVDTGGAARRTSATLADAAANRHLPTAAGRVNSGPRYRRQGGPGPSLHPRQLPPAPVDSFTRSLMLLWLELGFTGVILGVRSVRMIDRESRKPIYPFGGLET